MLARINNSIEDREDGFTLIELLVVIIIIGILAAIAIPVFLNQRNKGYDAQSKSDLRDMATAEETYLTDYNTYSTSVAGLQAEGFKVSANVTSDAVVGTVGNTSYCLSSTSQSGTVWYFGSVTPLGTTACTTS